MNRTVLAILMISWVVGVPLAVSEASASDSVQDTLKERFRISRMEVQNEPTEGRVLRPAAVLVLRTDGVSAKKFRTVQANTKSPRFHVRDYARVEIAQDGRLMAVPGDLTLAKGSQLVVLDVKIGSDEVRLFTHSLERVRLADGKAVYGCTEFVFRFEPGALDRGDLAAIQGRIGEVLTLTAAK